MNNHIPVLLEPIVESYLEHNVTNNVFDGTFGGGSYSYRFLESKANVFACDLDSNAINRAKKNKKLTLVKSNFANYIQDFDDNYFDMIVVDLGFSNNQLTIDEKGFSYQKKDQIVDLRYNEDAGRSCSDLLKMMKAETLSKILYENSGEIFSRKIANTIFENRDSVKSIKVSDLEKWIVDSIPQKFMNKKNQVLSRVWQSLRIHVNDEFESLKLFLSKAPAKLRVGGILCVVNFHSLEDKITTKTFRELSKTYDVDKFGNKGQDFELITRKPITANVQELEDNVQSRSATLRIIKKCQGQNK